ncbi:MaoC/PaaZ C-terminal domain-containing protein [Ramlibacter rhizophilus]|uniref:Uncharacterized protein n=1 Tax=Ramlibacter rhizophilus TaxID=1781167 RepID=A0A4Z0BL06_9BURK|nr:MaoC/PaaZ C-terminal domain-containing protein [Ramlibacter rhizophilus]TFZ00007.1 hypothetical protein EZ242_12830 [Ramlibacter rhizophilus]
MNPLLAATLICLGCHTAATAAEAQPAPQPVAQGFVVSAAAAAEVPVVRQAAAHAEPAARFANATLALQSPVNAQDTAREAAQNNSSPLLMVGLALIAGIALRRWGSARP